MTIGEKIKKYRKMSELTQQELAVYCDINVATIKKYELGQRNPKPEQIAKIAKGLSVNPLIFYDFEIKTLGDVMSLLFLISDITEMEIEVIEAEDEEVFPDIKINFKDLYLKFALHEWGNLISVLKSMKQNECLEDRSDIQKSLYQKANEMEAEFRHRMTEEQRVLSKEDKCNSPELKLDYITADDSIQAERLGLPLTDYLLLKSAGRLPIQDLPTS